MTVSYRSLLGATRLGQAPKLARRILGLKYLGEKDFLVGLSDDEKDRLAGLARRASLGPNTAPPVLVLGVMPRSGTNFLRDVLAEHPDLHPDPGRLYEFPLLHAADSAGAFMEDFIAMFPRNEEVLGKWDALAMLAGAWMRELQIEAGERRILLKCPHVQNVDLAPVIFPDAKIIICVRDGRDVAESTLKTFKRRSLARKTLGQLAHEWALGTEAALTFQPNGANANPNVLVVKYEEVVEDPSAVLPAVLDFADLNQERFPFEKIKSLPVRGSSRSEKSDVDKWQPEEKTKNFTPVGRWKDWSGSQKNAFFKVAGRALVEAGYD